jgi:DNA-binding NtrC family response regulator
VEREMIAAALARAGNNRSAAARLLGISRAQLYSRLEKHGLD